MPSARASWPSRRPMAPKPHADVLRRADAVGVARAAHAPRKVDHQSDPELRDRVHEPGGRAHHQDARLVGRGNIDVSDVHGDADEGDEIGQRLEERRLARGLPIRDDHGGTRCPLDQRRRRKGRVRRIAQNLARALEPREGVVAEIAFEGRPRMGQDYAQGAQKP